MPPRATALAVTLAVALVLAPAGIAAAQGGGTVTVTVALNDTDGDPVGNADLDAEWDGGSATATTASNGKAFLDVPEGAEVRVTVDHENYLREDPYVVQSASEREVSVRVYRKSAIRLEVSSDEGAVDDASVLIERGGLDVETGTTGENGVYETGVIREGDYDVTISKTGYFTRRKTLRAEGEITNRVALTRGSVPVRVDVADPQTDAPVADANVTFDGVGTAHTGGNGVATIETPVNTQSTLRVTKADYRTVSRDLSVGEEQTEVSVSLSRTPSLTVSAVNERVLAGERVALSVTDAYGNPATGVTVTLDGDAVGTTDDEGEIAVRIDGPGEHALRATDDGVTSDPVSVEAVDVDGTEAASTGTTAAAGTPSATETPTATTTSTSPGFTPVAAVLAVLAVGLFCRRGRRS